MTSEVPADHAVPAPAEPKPSPFARMVGALVSPDETFASIARRPDWVVPLVLILLVSLADGIVMARRVDFGAAVRTQMETRKDIPPETADRAAKMAGAVGKVAAYAAPVFSAIILLIMTAVLLLVFRLFGSEGTFLQAFSATVYAWMPGVIKSIIMAVVVGIKGTISAQQVATLVRSNLAFLVDMNARPMLFALLTSFDLFTIWTVVLLIIGFAHLGRVSKAKSAAIVLSLWAVTILLKLIPAAIQSMRA